MRFSQSRFFPLFPYIIRRIVPCLFLCSISIHAQEWELKRDKNGIKIYTRTLDSTRINEYKAIAVVKTSLEKALATILDGDNLWKWNYKTTESKIIKKRTSDEWVFWMKTDMPWPIKDRELVSRIQIHRPENPQQPSVQIDITPETEYLLPETTGNIRIVRFKGHWLLTQHGDYVEIIQQLYGDPNGNIPPWLVNMLITNAPYNTFYNLKTILEN